MTTKDIVEAILYLNKNTYKAFRVAHVINDTDRNWKPKQHDEYPFIQAFKNPKFLIIIDKQIHVYIIGDEFKKRSYNILNLEGYHADHLVLSKGQLIGNIKDTVKAKVFLPNNFSERIIFINGDQYFVFNKLSSKGNIFSKSFWSIGVDIYSVDNAVHQLSAYDILKEINKEF